MSRLTEDDVEWVVNDLAELGVKIKDQFFFMYKGNSYFGGSKWRYVFKREFGECVNPWLSIERKIYGDVKRDREVRIPDTFVGFLGEDEGEWSPFPAEKENESFSLIQSSLVDADGHSVAMAEPGKIQYVPPMSLKRKIIQLIPGGENETIALCSDGTSWRYSISRDSWKKMHYPEIPQD